MLLAAGTVGRPGMVMMSPQITTTNSAPSLPRAMPLLGRHHVRHFLC
jgi:hypothetical protein